MKSVADQAGAKGWVRNREDGNVEALVQGTHDQIEKVVSWCQRGPEKAKVDFVDVMKTECKETYRNFVIMI